MTGRRFRDSNMSYSSLPSILDFAYYDSCITSPDDGFRNKIKASLRWGSAADQSRQLAVFVRQANLVTTEPNAAESDCVTLTLTVTPCGHFLQDCHRALTCIPPGSQRRPPFPSLVPLPSSSHPASFVLPFSSSPLLPPYLTIPLTGSSTSSQSKPKPLAELPLPIVRSIS